MGQKLVFTVTESDEELQVFYKNQPTLKFQKRVLFLIEYKSGRFNQLSSLARFLNINRGSSDKCVPDLLSS